MPVFTFSKDRDAQYFRRRSAEKARLFYKPRRWLVHDDQIVRNIYGEPGSPVYGGLDGISSASATRRLTSAVSDFNVAGVQPSDVLEVREESCNSGDNGRYTVDSVLDAHTLEIDSNWPVGDLTGLKFNIHFLKERYVEFKHLVPFVVKLNPTEKELGLFGLSEKRDAMITLSIELCMELGLAPKIGDRFIYQYEGNEGQYQRSIHYEVKNLFEDTSLGDSGVALHYAGFAVRTSNKLP